MKYLVIFHNFILFIIRNPLTISQPIIWNPNILQAIFLYVYVFYNTWIVYTNFKKYLLKYDIVSS